MAGHSKWHNIQKRKGAVDAKRGKVFTQISKNIRTAVKQGGSGDPRFNAALRLILDKARAANMPQVKIQRAIDVALGKNNGASLKEVVYEGFGPGGIGILAIAFTDNPNRTASEVRALFSRAGGSLGSPGSAMYMFSRGDDGEYTTTMPFAISDEKQQADLQNLLDQLSELDDVEDVYCAGEWPGKE